MKIEILVLLSEIFAQIFMFHLDIMKKKKPSKQINKATKMANFYKSVVTTHKVEEWYTFLQLMKTTG